MLTRHRAQAVQTARLAEAAGQLGTWVGEPAQRAVLTLITTGDLECHTRRMRHEYARRRAAVTAAFADGQAGRLLGDHDCPPPARPGPASRLSEWLGAVLVSRGRATGW